MKKIYFIIVFLCVSTVLLAQSPIRTAQSTNQTVTSSSNTHSSNFDKRTTKPIALQVLSAQDNKQEFFPFTLFTKVNKDTLHQQVSLSVDSFSILSINPNELKKVLSTRPHFLQLTLPNYNGLPIEILLIEHAVTAPNFSVKMSNGETIDVNKMKGIHYWGIIKNKPNSSVAISIFEKDIMGIISTGTGNTVLGKLNKSDQYIIYNDVTVKGTNTFLCGNPDDHSESVKKNVSTQPTQQLGTTNCVQLYWEINYDIYLDKGSVGAANYAIGLFNETQLLYANDNITVSLVQLLVWNSPSPYGGTTSFNWLSSFQNNLGVFTGDLAHLLTYSNTTGGIAATIPGLCSSNWADKKCFSGIYNFYNNIPMYSWTVNVVTHEQGHLMGSRHTHACVWNGNNTAIDGCGPAAGYPYEGSCSGAPIPVMGTIMSYCHLSPNPGIDLSYGFGSQPAAVIINTINNASCLSTCSPCSPTTSNDHCFVPAPPVLTVGSSCNYVNGSTCGATASFTSGVSGTSCSTSGYDANTLDVWYSFVATCTNPTITVQSGSNFDAVYELYSSACSTSTQIGSCVDVSGMGGIEQATTSTNLTIGSTYFIRVYDYHENLNAGLSGGTDFQICVTCNTSSGVACTNYASIPFSASYNENANSGTFSVSASGTGCMFSAMSNCSWINSLTTSPGVVAYNVDANTNCSSRTCTISIFDGSSVLQPSATYTVTQAGVSPPSCGTIFSSTNICESSIQNYSISCSNATSYNWIVPFGWFINSGQRTSSINVTVGANTGQVCVIPFNGNCQSAPVCSNTILVTPMPSQLGLITGATTTQPNTQQSYFVPAISSAIAYQWTTPFTWTVVANGTSNTPTFDMNSGSSGNLCVSAINSCGISSPSCIFISTASVGIYEVGATTKFTIYPNPSEEIIHIMGDGIGNGTYEIVLTNAVGQQVKNQSLKISTHSMETVISIEELPSGIYFLSISSDMVKQIVKVEKR